MNPILPTRDEFRELESHTASSFDNNSHLWVFSMSQAPTQHFLWTPLFHPP